MIAVTLEQLAAGVDLERVEYFPSVPRRGDLIDLAENFGRPRIRGTVSHVTWRDVTESDGSHHVRPLVVLVTAP